MKEEKRVGRVEARESKRVLTACVCGERFSWVLTYIETAKIVLLKFR